MTVTHQKTVPLSADALSDSGTPPDDPLDLFRTWLADAAENDVREPGALALATADARGRASNRIIQLGRLTSDGFVFTTHVGSLKGRDIEATAWGSAVLYWRETDQQIVLSGPITRLPDAESDALWAVRPADAKVVTSASRQSDPLDDEPALRAEIERLTGLEGQLPRPATFAGYHLAPETVEFWHASKDRLHKRLLYTRTADGWSVSRLQP
ncbi:phenazine biosynthesis FMN-dependent oxidase PhzG [Streptomyces sp. BH-SS-21]|uniref:Phenazine biosynthesis FMN-dependent oxidase PhzG n=1 Tax=Streptomyces liliiviolaceus TaxID=2823109 RepID=A0A941BEE9_9ACTN|nr:phenazine biosynthesis FMN-dependent oxidase PhzG [Streptomyces liliiviolaceus]MBQ0850499.1 phenazine biosynthesis FMN-dependent oxidase PhzG [Streptomyces liliiviolaceus]